MIKSFNERNIVFGSNKHLPPCLNKEHGSQLLNLSVSIYTSLADSFVIKFHVSHSLESLLRPLVNPIDHAAVDKTGVVSESGPELSSDWRKGDRYVQILNYFA